MNATTGMVGRRGVAEAGGGPSDAVLAAASAGWRRAYVDADVGVADVPVFGLTDLREGDRLAGPALIDGADSTTFVARGFGCRAGPYRILHLVVR